MVAVWVDGKAAAWQEFAPYFDVLWIEQVYQIVHDDVDAVFVEVAVVAEGKQIELEALAFHELLIRHIGNVDGGKVWLASDWAKAGEFWAVEFDKVVVFRMFVIEGFENVRGVIGVIGDVLIAKQGQVFFFSGHGRAPFLVSEGRVGDTIGGKGCGTVDAGAALAARLVTAFVAGPGQFVRHAKLEADGHNVGFILIHKWRFDAQLMAGAFVDGSVHGVVEHWGAVGIGEASSIIGVSAVIDDLTIAAQRDAGSSGEKEAVAEWHIGADRCFSAGLFDLFGVAFFGNVFGGLLQKGAVAVLEDQAEVEKELFHAVMLSDCFGSFDFFAVFLTVRNG